MYGACVYDAANFVTDGPTDGQGDSRSLIVPILSLSQTFSIGLVLDFKFRPHHSGTRAVVAKVAMDQALFAPSFLCVFVTAVSTLQGLGIKEIKENLSQNYVDIVLTNWKIWPATQLINFYFVPFQHRILVSEI